MKVITHCLDENLIILSKDLWDKVYHDNGIELINTTLNLNGMKVVYDEYLSFDTIMVPDKQYFDQKRELVLSNIEIFMEGDKCAD
ncbi:hypothetical protein 2018Mat167_0730 [Vibrio phage ICP1]|nr:hypothetical protein TUST1-191_00750 [Vibrio phage ICP1_2006_D]ADX88423.1 hypothetical protein TUST1-182_00750 [Vibrio phage ICP1_2006_C]QFR59210.1 hypothetical protein ICP12017FMathbaria_150 [Vibrio phage ICP1_2017_F_Mathbaria]QVW04195.1 hypothetical protein 2017MatI_0765 [Vibrio phage ICP1]QVW04422.1 hypothetical protein 2017MatK_0770 [Vibrio phage ICP1]